MSPSAPGHRPLSDRVRRRIRRHVTGPARRHVLAPLRRRRNAERSFRPVFVTGAMGSGTTLLALSLGSRFDFAAVVTESAHQVAAESFLHLPRLERFASVREFEEAILPEPGWSVEAGRSALLDLYRSEAAGPSDVVVDKGPNTNLVRADFLYRCFPDACFLLVFRDPVANVEGFRRKWSLFGRDALDESIRFYRSVHERFLADAQRFPDRVHVIEYTTLVGQHEEVLDRLGAELSLDPARRRPSLPTRSNAPGQGIRNVRRNRLEVVQDAETEAIRRVPGEQAVRIRSALEPLHARLRAASLRP